MVSFTWPEAWPSGSPGSVGCRGRRRDRKEYGDGDRDACRPRTPVAVGSDLMLGHWAHIKGRGGDWRAVISGRGKGEAWWL